MGGDRRSGCVFLGLKIVNTAGESSGYPLKIGKPVGMALIYSPTPHGTCGVSPSRFLSVVLNRIVSYSEATLGSSQRAQIRQRRVR